jgi:glycosyltransferase involved in cell wall biosynthesis
MRVLLIRPPSGGGVGSYYDNIKAHFISEVHYFYTGVGGIHSMPLGKQIRDYFAFIKTIANSDYDLVHINPSLRPIAVIRDGIYLLIAKFFRKKTLIFFRGWDDEFEKIIRKWYLKLFKQVFFSADAIIVLASRYKSALQEMGCAKPIFLETTIVADEVFDLSRNNHLKRNIPGKINILFLSRIESYKGIYEAIEAFAILKRKYKGINMTMAGDGSELESLKNYLADKNITGIKITGWLDGVNKKQAFEDADIYFLPTYGEGMPNSLLEAMAYGLPVITRPVGGITDFFLDGEMGFISESSKPEELAQLCENLIKDEKRRVYIGRFNFNYAKKHFIASEVCRRLEAIYQGIINTGNNDIKVKRRVEAKMG